MVPQACHYARFIIIFFHHDHSFGMIQGSDDPQASYPLMAISSKRTTNKLGVKESSSGLDSKTEAIYAFCTITTMLSLIQSTRDTAGKRQKLGQQEKLVHTQLQLLDAFAAVLVRNNGVIAVTSKPYNHGSGEVEVLASYMGNGESHITSQPQSTGLIRDIIRNVFVSQNPRDVTVKQREVVDPETLIPSHFKEISNPTTLLITFLSEFW